MDGFDAALARYRAFLAHDPITPLLRRSLALLVPGNIRVDTVTADDSLRCTTDGAETTLTDFTTRSTLFTTPQGTTLVNARLYRNVSGVYVPYTEK